jgi:nickel-dependent lactate racemase
LYRRENPLPVFKIPFGEEFVNVNIEDRNFSFYAPPVKMKTLPDQDAVIDESLDNPFGTGRLEEMVKPSMRICVMVDDITRPTPRKKILPKVLKRLESAGVPKDNIKIVIGLGTHRKMTDFEIDSTIGKENIAGYELVNIDYRDSSRFVNLGTTPGGTPVEVYREVVESDFKIAIGNITPHIAAGWGGGAKMIQPGVCSEKTTEVTHLKACTIQSVLEVCGNADNEVRREMEIIAGDIVGLDFIVNTVLDETKNILGVFSGHFIKAHREGIKLAKKVICPKIPEKADILIASANPSHVDYWQGCKPFIYAQYGVKEGGVLVFLLDGKEGLCGSAPRHEMIVREYSLKSFESICEAVEKGEIDDIVGINVPLFHSRIRGRVTTICVSNGFTKEDCECLGFIHANDIEEAIDKAFEIKGKTAKVGIIPYCGETLVRVDDGSNS